MKNFRIFHLKTFIFLVVKFSVYLNRLVLAMLSAHAVIRLNIVCVRRGIIQAIMCIDNSCYKSCLLGHVPCLTFR